MGSLEKGIDIEKALRIKSYLPTRKHTPEELSRFQDLLLQHPKDRNYLTHKEYAKDFAPNKKELDDFKALAEEKGWSTSVNKKAREIQISIAKAQDSEEDSLLGIKAIGNRGDINLEANRIHESNLKQGFVKSNLETRGGQRNPIPMANENHGHSVFEIAEVYNFPNADGEGQTVGIIELGGKFKKSDFNAFFDKYGLEVPKIQVSGKPSKTPQNENLEVTADVQVLGGLVPKAKLVIYYGTSILDGMKKALADTRNDLSVISISWAGSELGYSQIELRELNNVFYEASLRGITVVAASGDYGALNNKMYPNVNVPVNFPFVLGCGGTRMEVLNDAIVAETIWNESQGNMQIGTGGGFSKRVSLASYQQNAVERYLATNPEFIKYDTQRGRAVPDVAANAADASGYAIFFNGEWTKIGGTSLATPLWAALIVRMNQIFGYKLGFINELLYQLEGTDVFHPITAGNNNLYTGGIPWNPCTGLGSPDGTKLLAAIAAYDK